MLKLCKEGGFMLNEILRSLKSDYKKTLATLPENFWIVTSFVLKFEEPVKLLGIYLSPKEADERALSEALKHTDCATVKKHKTGDGSTVFIPLNSRDLYLPFNLEQYLQVYTEGISKYFYAQNFRTSKVSIDYPGVLELIQKTII